MTGSKDRLSISPERVAAQETYRANLSTAFEHFGFTPEGRAKMEQRGNVPSVEFAPEIATDTLPLPDGIADLLLKNKQLRPWLEVSITGAILTSDKVSLRLRQESLNHWASFYLKDGTYYAPITGFPSSTPHHPSPHIPDEAMQSLAELPTIVAQAPPLSIFARSQPIEILDHPNWETLTAIKR